MVWASMPPSSATPGARESAPPASSTGSGCGSGPSGVLPSPAPRVLRRTSSCPSSTPPPPTTSPDRSHHGHPDPGSPPPCRWPGVTVTVTVGSGA
ncbi:hypothetical protein [Nonomuraea rubra]|uniref:hypothetical protein n=1 Tax=Nonomuraea rubra TaxID=46180 RepID=UPI0031EBA615